MYQFREELIIDEATGELLVVYAANLDDLEHLANQALEVACAA